MKRCLLLLLLSLKAFTVNAVEAPGAINAAGDSADNGFALYDEYEYDLNFGDCLDFDFGFGMDICPPRWPKPPYPTLTLEYGYNDVVAMVEVVPDPWRSFLYKESFFDFSSKADTAILSGLGMSPSIGSGFGNRKSNSDEFIGNHKMESHVWAVSDWWRLKTSDPKDGCFSLTCKNKDYTGCVMSIKQTVTDISNSMQQTMDSINTGETVEGKGEGVTQAGENGQADTVIYEDGSMSQETLDGEGNPTGQFEEVRPAGNYGDGVIGTMAETAMSESIIPGMNNLEMVMEGVALAKDPEGYAKGKALGLAGDAINAGLSYAGDAAGDWAAENDMDFWNSDTPAAGEGGLDAAEGAGSGGGIGGKDTPYNENLGDYKTDKANSQYVDQQAQQMNSWANNMKAEMRGKSKALPDDTKGKKAEIKEMSPVDGAGAAGSAVENGEIDWSVSDNMQNNDSEGNSEARDDMMSNISGAGGSLGSAGLNQAMAIIDRIVYFSPIELLIQMIATVSPVMLFPVYMSERHEDPSADGGFFWAPIFQQFADMGAGFIMPIFCMTKTVGMAVDGVFSLFMEGGISSNILGPISSFINGRCVGSWGPLEPRVTMMGTGDHMVAAGLASVRGLNIAQNITGDQFNKTINNTPFNSLKFNLEWPHRSGCYGFQGFDGLSRGWTTPIGGALDGVSGAVKTGDMSAVAGSLGNATVGGLDNQGGYVFTYWRHRKCRYLIGCDKWRGDTGL